MFFLKCKQNKKKMNFRNIGLCPEPDLSTARLVPLPGRPVMMPYWYVHNLPTPNVGAGPLFPVRWPVESFAGSLLPRASDFECKDNFK
jgi:hypothetical protein